jgi:alpha-galactosidase
MSSAARTTSSELKPLELFGKAVRTGHSSRRLGRARFDINVEKTAHGLLVRGTVLGRPGRVEVLRLPVPRLFLMNNWQSWGPAQTAGPSDIFPELRAIHAANPYGFSPLLGELLERVWSDYFIAWDGACLGFLTSRIAHPFFLVEGTELVGYLEYFKADFEDPVPVEPLAILRDGAVENLLDVYGSLVKKENRVRIDPWNPVGWCSWYHYFGNLTWDDVVRNVETARELRRDFPFEVFQLDDGYEQDIGDWLKVRPGYPPLDGLADGITRNGFKAGIWTAPFSASETSDVFAKHPGWMVAEGGRPKFCHRSWSRSIFALDVTHPRVQSHIFDIFAALKRAGFEYFKIDFLFGSAMPGDRRKNRTPIQAYREGLRIIRRAVGRGFVLGCGAPLLPSAGLVDGMRIGEDTAPYWKTKPSAFQGPNAYFALKNALLRQFMHRRFWLNDPDCVLLRDREIELTGNERELYALTCGALDNMIIDSDNLGLVGDGGKELFRRVLKLRGGKSRVLGLLGDGLYTVSSRGGQAGEFSLKVNLTDETRDTGEGPIAPHSGRLTRKAK